MGYTIFATEGTANYFNQGGIDAKIIRKVDDKAIGCDILSLIQSGRINFVVNTISKSSKSSKDGFMIRRVSVENNVACFTSMDTFAVLARVIENLGFSVKEF
jgi:carbamoyl-phosphate synthase large subunit